MKNTKNTAIKQHYQIHNNITIHSTNIIQNNKTTTIYKHINTIHKPYINIIKAQQIAKKPSTY